MWPSCYCSCDCGKMSCNTSADTFISYLTWRVGQFRSNLPGMAATYFLFSWEDIFFLARRNFWISISYMNLSQANPTPHHSCVLFACSLIYFKQQNNSYNKHRTVQMFEKEVGRNFTYTLYYKAAKYRHRKIEIICLPNLHCFDKIKKRLNHKKVKNRKVQSN